MYWKINSHQVRDSHSNVKYFIKIKYRFPRISRKHVQSLKPYCEHPLIPWLYFTSLISVISSCVQDLTVLRHFFILALMNDSGTRGLINKSQREQRLLIKLSPDRIFGFPVSSFLLLGRRSIRRNDTAKGTTEAKETTVNRLLRRNNGFPASFLRLNWISCFLPPFLCSFRVPTLLRSFSCVQWSSVFRNKRQQRALKTSISYRTIWTNLTDSRTMATYDAFRWTNQCTTVAIIGRYRCNWRIRRF